MAAARAALLGVVLGLAACGPQSPYVPPPFTGEPTPLYPPEEAWARVLKASVDARGQVDFNALISVHEDLDRYVAWIYERSPERYPEHYRTRAHVLAFHANAYNALVLYSLLQAGLPAAPSERERKRLFGWRKVMVGGQPVTLDEYRGQIRALGEPRVHFALSRQYAGDPRLSREPYRASLLEGQLDRAARTFLAEDRNVRVDAARHAVVLAALLKEFAPDFGASPAALAAWAARYRDAPVPASYKVEFAAFDWTLRRAGALPQR